MPVGEPHLSSVLLTHRLLWNRALNGSPRPQPVVVLLGPVGSGKTTALESISTACGAEVVHARFDFQDDERAVEPPTTVETLARIAFVLSRRWKARGAARFTRFTLGFIAVQTSLEGLTREQAKEKIRLAIKQFTKHPRTDQIIANLERLTDAANSARVLKPRTAEIVKTLLPALIRTVGRRPLGPARRWHAEIPEAEGSTPLDALVSLSCAESTEITKWLTAAFLADIRESHPRMAKPDQISRCPCPNLDKNRHWHNWVLLLDNIDHPGGARFVTDLLAARERHLRRNPGDHDALLVIMTSGRWDSHWESEWCAPWKSVLDNTRAVPLCREANYEHWIGQGTGAPRSPYYPVLLEPLTIDETAEILEISQRKPECIMAQRATGGLPAAVHFLKELLRDRSFQPGARDVFGPGNPAYSDDNLWRERLDGLRLVRYLPDISIDQFVTAAPFATAPWLLPPTSTSLVSRPNGPHVGRILTELRTALWGIAPKHGGATPNYAELHPWIAGTLVSALAQRPSAPNRLSYTDQFEALLNDPDTLGDPARKAYCQLALRRISEVVDAFEECFDTVPHRDWIDRLELATRAPDHLPLDRSSWELYEQLVNTAAHGRSPAGNTITRLITARWLMANPFATSDPNLREVIKNAYEKELPPLSRRPDVAALYEAARRADDPLF